MTTTINRRWVIKQGNARGEFMAPDWESARLRAYQCGFKRPDSIVLKTAEQDYSSLEAFARAAVSKLARGD